MTAGSGTLRARIAALVLAVVIVPAIHAEEKIVVGALPFVSSAPVFLAAQAGLFARYGLEVEIEFFRAAQPVALAVMTGDVDIGVTGLTAGFYNLAHRADLRVIGGQSRVEPGFRFIAYCVARTAFEDGFDSLDEYEGKRVGITQKGSTFHYMIGLLAEKRGLDFDAIRLIPLESVPNMVAAIRGGGVDSVLLPAHLALPLAEEGAVEILGWAGDEIPWQLGAVFTTQENLIRRSSAVERFMLAYQEATVLYADAFLQRDRDGIRIFGDAAIRLAEDLKEYIPATTKQILEGAPFIRRDVRITAADIEAQLAWFQARRLVDRAVDAQALVVPVPSPTP